MKYRTLFEGVRDRHNTSKDKKVSSMFESLNLPKIKEKEEELPLKKAISRLAYFYSARIFNATSDKIGKYNAALNLLNQAQMIVDEDVKVARKLYQQARKLFRG